MRQIFQQQLEKNPRIRLITLFVDNLPEAMDSVWLGQIFQNFGPVRDVFIPKKRSTNGNRRFGFVRFDKKEDAFEAIRFLEGAIIRECKLHVKIASFISNRLLGSSFSFENHGPALAERKRSSSNHLFNNSNSVEDKHSQYSGHLWTKPALNSFEDEEKEQNGLLSIPAEKVGNAYLLRSAIAELRNFCLADYIKEAFLDHGDDNIQVSDLGGKSMLLTFCSVNDRNLNLNSSPNWHHKWFESVRPWTAGAEIRYGRVVWLSCYGVPPHLWNTNNFLSMGHIWGECLSIDEDTVKELSFAAGKIKIFTSVFEVINKVIYLESNGQLFPVRVVEEQVVKISNVQSCNMLAGAGEEDGKIEDHDGEGGKDGKSAELDLTPIQGISTATPVGINHSPSGNSFVEGSYNLLGNTMGTLRITEGLGKVTAGNPKQPVKEGIGMDISYPLCKPSVTPIVTSANINVVPPSSQCGDSSSNQVNSLADLAGLSLAADNLVNPSQHAEEILENYSSDSLHPDMLEKVSDLPNKDCSSLDSLAPLAAFLLKYNRKSNRKGIKEKTKKNKKKSNAFSIGNHNLFESSP